MKKKTGAWLRWSNRATTAEAILIESRAPAADTPAAFYRESAAEARAPWGTAFAETQRASRARI